MSTHYLDIYLGEGSVKVAFIPTAEP